MSKRIVVAVVLALAIAGCRNKPATPAPPEPDRNPYRNVMPDKVKKQVEDSQKREEQRDDKLLENAK